MLIGERVLDLIKEKGITQNSWKMIPFLWLKQMGLWSE